jgi:osmotically-inducible protein OsmY
VGVEDTIELNPQASATQVKEQVEAALLRQARVDAKSIVVNTSGGKVTLSGHASSWQALADASDAAWAAPGVHQVVDNMRIQFAIGLRPRRRRCPKLLPEGACPKR